MKIKYIAIAILSFNFMCYAAENEETIEFKNAQVLWTSYRPINWYIAGSSFIAIAKNDKHQHSFEAIELLS